MAIIARNYSKCDACGSDFSYKESCNPDVEEVDTVNGIKIITTRTYKCSKCGHEKQIVEKELAEHK